MRIMPISLILLASAAPAAAQTPAASITLYELPGYLGRSVTITADTPDLATQSFAKRAQSARVTGSWQVCPSAKFAGTCRTLTANTPLLIKSQVVSIRPTPIPGTTTGTTTNSSATATENIDLDALDPVAGTEGQDSIFHARPALSGSEIWAGTNDLTTATAYCKLAGATNATQATRTRVQASNLIDIAGKKKVRGFALRDVVCKR